MAQVTKNITIRGESILVRWVGKDGEISTTQYIVPPTHTGLYVVVFARDYLLDCSIDIGLKTFTIIIIKATRGGKWLEIPHRKTCDLTNGSKFGGKGTTSVIIKNMASMFHNVELLPYVDRVFIEQQFISKGFYKGRFAQTNDDARHLQWAAMSYITTKADEWHRDIKIIPVSSMTKLQGLPKDKKGKKLGGDGYKEWTRQQTIATLRHHGLNDHANDIEGLGTKGYDQGDAIRQYEVASAMYDAEKVW
jgi:hypothetical protein